MSFERSSAWVAFGVAALFLALATGVSGQTAAYTVKINVDGPQCAGETLTYSASLEPDLSDKRAQWFIDQPDGTRVTSTELRIAHVMRLAGTYTVTLIVSDSRGNKLGSEVLTLHIPHCDVGSTPGSTPTNADCYSDEYGYYDCEYPAGESRCALYRDEQTGETYERCEAQPSTTPSPYNADECASLSESQNQFYRQWKYDYHAYYERMGTKPGSDAHFEEKMRLQRERFDSDWQNKWNTHGCDRPYSNPECESRWKEAHVALVSLKDKWGATWTQFYADMDRTRASWSSYSEDKRQALETEWRRSSAWLADQYNAALEAIADRHNLWECGFVAERPPIEPMWNLNGRAPMASSLTTLRSDCDDRMAATKEIYVGEFQTLRAKLEAEQPGTAAYESARQRLADLERKVASEVEAILAQCRNEYRDRYNAPGNFRDGIGSLQCYYVESSAKIHCQGTYVSIVGDPQSQFLSRFSCGGQPVFDDIYANHLFENVQFIDDQKAASLLIRSENLKLLFHDGPRGVINVGAVGDAELYLVPSPQLVVETMERGLELRSQSGWTSTFASSGTSTITYDDIRRIISVRGEATWIAQTCRPDGSDPDGDLGSAFYEAIKQRRMGAQVTISLDGDDSNHDEEDYANMDIDVQHLGGKKFLATIDSAEGACKTVVLKFNEGIFDTIKLKLLMEDSDSNAIKVDEASNLADVLDPCNDGDEGFEYWIVQDRLGTQVLVSFAHFSEKRVSVESASVGNVIVPGFDGITATLAVAVAALVFVGIRRRLTR